MSVVQIHKRDAGTMISVIDNDTAIALWPKLRSDFQRSLEAAHDDMTDHNLMAGILDGRMIPMVICVDDEIVGSALLEIAQLRKHKVLHCIHFAGDDLEVWVDEWMETWKELARELGCDIISIKGREGWARYARKHGFKHTYTIMHLEV